MEQLPYKSMPLMDIITNLLGLTNYQPQVDIPPELSQQLVDYMQDDQRRKRAWQWSEQARRILRGEPAMFPAPNYSGPGLPTGDYIPLPTEEGGAVMLQPGKWSDRTTELSSKQKGKRRKPGER